MNYSFKFMYYLLYFILLSISFPLLISCGEDRNNTKQPSKKPINNTKKDSTVNKKNSKLNNKKNSTIKITNEDELKGLRTRVDKLMEKNASLIENNAELELENSKLEQIKAGGISLKRSTYTVKKPDQVQEVLDHGYGRMKSVFEYHGMSTLGAQKVRKMFTIEYCDDQILKELDLICEEFNTYLGNSMRVKIDYLYKTDKESKKEKFRLGSEFKKRWSKFNDLK